MSVMASNVSESEAWHRPIFCQYKELVREAQADEGGRNTDLDDFGYHLPFFHPTGEFRLE